MTASTTNIWAAIYRAAVHHPAWPDVLDPVLTAGVAIVAAV